MKWNCMSQIEGRTSQREGKVRTWKREERERQGCMGFAGGGAQNEPSERERPVGTKGISEIKIALGCGI